MSIADSEMSRLVLGNIVTNALYAKKVVPYIEESFFADATEKAIAKVIKGFFDEHAAIPNSKEVVIMLKDLTYVNQLDKAVINDVFSDGTNITSQDWLSDQTERFIRRRRVSNAFELTYGQFEGGEAIEDFSDVFRDALAFHFDDSIGHSLVDQALDRWELYTSDEDRLSMYLDMLDLVTNGGVPKATLNCFLAGTGVGKSLVMCDMAAKAALNGEFVVYISMEMADLRLAERLEANLMDVPLNKLKHLSQQEFTVKQQIYVNKMKKSGGDVIFKQYPTSGAHAGHFRNLLTDIHNKKGRMPDRLFIDYLNICDSARSASGDNSYTKIKNIAEELRGLAVEFDVPIFTATQTNRGGQASTDLSFEDVSESHGLAATVDLLIGLISTEEWEACGKLMMSQVKNRYGDVNYYKKFMVGLERSKMRLFNLAQEASDELHNNGDVGQANVAGRVDTEAVSALDFSALVKNNKPNLSTLKT